MIDSTVGDVHPRDEGAERFAYHRRMSPLLWALLAIGVLETGVVHLFLFHLSPTVALVLLTLSALVLIGVVALLLSFRRRPVILSDASLRVRTGFLLDADIPLDEIAFGQNGFAPADYMQGSLLKANLLAYPNAVVLLRRDIPLPGPFGRTKVVHAVALAVDEPARFLPALKRRLEEAQRKAA